MKAQKIFEQLDQEIAPGHIEARMARINFEYKTNSEKAKELLNESFKKALSAQKRLEVTFWAQKYSELFEQSDHSGTCETYQAAINDLKKPNVVLYLSYSETLKSSDKDDKVNKIKSVFDEAVGRLESIQEDDPEEFSELSMITHHYVNFL